MSNKNRVITLSGQPATGKSTVKDILLKKYQEKGIEVEEYTTGGKFREYFLDIKEFLKGIQDRDFEKLRKLNNKEIIRTIMYNENGSLNVENANIIKNTLKEIKEKNIDISSYDIEKVNRSETLKEIRNLMDQAVDGYIKNVLIKEINATENPNVIWIIDSRLAGSNIAEDEAFSVRLVSSEKVAGQRAYNRFLKNFDSFIESILGDLEENGTGLKEKIASIDAQNAEEISDKQKLEEKFSEIEERLYKISDKNIKYRNLEQFLKLKEESYENEEKAIEKTRKRKLAEQERYIKFYGVDLEDVNNYNLVLDTSNLNPEEEAQIIFEKEQKAYTTKGYERKREEKSDEER